jgi:serine/threonine-protein kinase
MDPLTPSGATPPFDNSDDAEGIGLANLTGRQLGRYLIGERLGAGGAATVYRAFDQVEGQTVALKVLLPSADEKTYTRFRREALTAGALRHPNIVRILQVGTAPHGEVAYIAMELVEGESLADLLVRQRVLAPAEACALLAPVARALAHAHAAGVIHRDVKPSNILLRPAQRGEPNSVLLEALQSPVVPLLSDFGIARSLDAPELTSAGRTVGTPAYMAPEQAAGSRTVDGRADIYALGTVLYRAVVGRLPFTGSATQILHAHVYEPIAVDSTVIDLLPPDMLTILRRSLAKRPEDRYATPLQMAEAMERLVAAAPPPAEQDPLLTATMEMAAARDRTPTQASTTILVPGVSDPYEGSTTTVSPYAPRRPGATSSWTPAGAQPAVERPTTQGGTGLYAATALVEDEEPTTKFLRWRNPWLWLVAIVLAILLGGLTAAIETSLSRGGRLAGAGTPTLTATPSATPTATPTPRPGAGTPSTLVIILPPEGERTPLPTFVLPPSATPTLPLIILPATPTTLPTMTPTLTLTWTPLPPNQTPTWTPPPPTVTPTWTPPPAATPTELPPPTATSAPTLAPTSMPTPAPTETPTELPTATPIPAATATPTPEPPTETPTPDAPPCAQPIDPAFVEFVSRLDPVTRPGFDCPLGPASGAAGGALAFQGGSMLWNGVGAILVQAATGGWDEVATAWREGDPSPLPPDAAAPPGLFLPSGRFAEAWLQPAVQASLGYATEAQERTLPVIQQAFAGGLLVALPESGEVVPFLTANRGL